MKYFKLIMLFLLTFEANSSDVVNHNQYHHNRVNSKKLTRKARINPNQRKLQAGSDIFNGNVLGMALGGAGVGMAFSNQDSQQRKLKETLSVVKSQFFRAQVLSQRNKELYKDMDEILMDLEDKIENMGDDVYQKLSDFDNSIKSKLTGRTYMPTFSGLH